MEDAVPYRSLIEKHHAAMLAGDESAAVDIRREANDLAHKLDRENHGILAGPEASGCVLANATAAPVGTVPMWGQEGEFTINMGSMPVRVTMDGMLGICASMNVWPGFAVHAVDYGKPFLSETGDRSFLGCHAEMVPGLTPDVFVREMLSQYINSDCNGKLRRIGHSYVEREMQRRKTGNQQAAITSEAKGRI
jgi:hypothetical protein